MRSLVLICIATAVAIAQESGPYSVSGMVINSRTNEPVRRALVRLTSFQLPKNPTANSDTLNPGRLVNSVAMTDAAGTFRFVGLPEGYYSIAAEKPEFTADVSGVDASRNQITLKGNINNTSLHIAPLGVIHGKVSDESGQPLSGISVLNITQTVNDGFRDSQIRNTVTTDDRGLYRIWALRPGKYFVKAAGRTGGTSLYIGEVSASVRPGQSFEPIYSGGALTLDSATPIEVQPGSDTQADITVTRQRAFHIRGKLTGFVPTHAIKFELLKGTEDVSASRVVANPNTGRFDVSDVVPGSYTLRATQGSETRGEVAVNIGNADMDRVNMTLSPAVSLSWHLTLTGAPAEFKNPRTGGVLKVSGADLERNCSVRLHSGDDRAGGSVGDGRESQINGVLPGTYPAVVWCFQAFVTSAFYGTQDLLTNSMVTINPGGTPATIEIVARYGGGTGTGLVKTDSPGGGSMRSILLVPQVSGTSGPVLLSSDGDGKFFIPAVSPGEYSAYIFARAEDVEYRNPAFLRSLTGGSSVHIDDGSNNNITVTGGVR